MRILSFLLSLILAASALPSPAAEPTSIELILDCSGSMWNKLADGRYRIDAAKQVLSEFIATAPDQEGLNIGLRLYGSRVSYHDKGACEDSVLLVPIEGFRRKEMLKIVKDARALGATPLARSLNAAADDLTPCPGKKQVIVFTDGEESCDGDVKAALARLNSDEIKADVRIIGIGLPKAAAERFAQMVPSVNTDTAKSLAAALKDATTTITPPSPPPAVKQSFTVKVTHDGRPLSSGGVSIAGPDGKAVILEKAKQPGTWTASVSPGLYAATITPMNRVFPSLSVTRGEDALFELDVTEAPKVTIEVPAGPFTTLQDIEIKYAGANGGEGQYVVIAPAGAPDDAEPEFAKAPGKDGSVTIKTMADPGRFEARFLALTGSQYGICGRSKIFETVQPKVSLEMASKVKSSMKVEVTFHGTPQDGDWIGWVKAGAPDGDYVVWSRPDGATSKVTLVAPSEPGDYEMRYCNNNSNSVHARFAFKVEASELMLAAPESLMAGARLPVKWAAPTAGDIWVTVVKKGVPDSEYTAYVYLNAEQTNPALLPTPNQPGEYEVRMVTDGSTKVAIRNPIKLTEPKATFKAPAEARIGVGLMIEWSGPNSSGDAIYISKKDTADEEKVSYLDIENEQNKGEISVPSEAGTYELRYVDRDRKVLGRQPLEVKP